ncbi:atypical membrane-integrating protein (Mistic protein) [Bacillaceae bacterium SIJ1]|uniref:atypical membrane-integrating protein (Mistic protein) n=1 Tax=Litoribacterium kuwaitense TaxID=1398745 RepID=UPI0013ED96B0|nr:atypical membrane-integrating protein (Mistic protein) [Litoribacterium kuwaitense]NGP46149.1 atypical membrane-integrating protein (Mistic protein) [Litoribacterium kuwaitense]
MYLSKEEQAALSKAIDDLNAGLDTFIELYNDSEEQAHFMIPNDDVRQLYKQAIHYDDRNSVDYKLNRVLTEVLKALLPDKPEA